MARTVKVTLHVGDRILLKRADLTPITWKQIEEALDELEDGSGWSYRLELGESDA